VSNRPNKLKDQLSRLGEQQRSAGAAPAATVAVKPTDAPVPTAPRSRPRTARRRPPAAGEAWGDRVKRATFYVDRALLDELDACCEKHGMNKSEFVREAITRHLKTYR
jgi:hypothetical protein